MNSVNQHTKFNELYNSLINELNVAGGVAGVFGAAAGDGDVTTGWGDPDDVRIPVALGSKKRKKRKNKKRKKRSRKVKESDNVAYTKGPVQTRPDIPLIGVQSRIK